MVRHLHAEAFEYYFHRFTEENAPTEETKSFQVSKKALLEKLSSNKTESEPIKDAVNLNY